MTAKTGNTVKQGGADVLVQGDLPEPGTLFPDYSLVGVDERAVDALAFEGKNKVYFLCEGPEHDATATFIAAAAAAVDGAADTVLIPIARTAPLEWRRFLRAHNIEGVAPLCLGDDVAVPFPVLQGGAGAGHLCPALVYVDDADEVFAAQRATDADSLAGLDIAALLLAQRPRA